MNEKDKEFATQYQKSEEELKKAFGERKAKAVAIHCSVDPEVFTNLDSSKFSPEGKKAQKSLDSACATMHRLKVENAKLFQEMLQKDSGAKSK